MARKPLTHEVARGGKVCKKCGRRLTLASYNKNHHTTIDPWCRDCHSEYRREWRKREMIIIYADEPLLKAYYEEKIVDGRKVIVREVRSTGDIQRE